MKQERVFKNTFEPACRDRELRVSGIVAGLRFGAFKYDRLPPKVRKAVDEELERMAKGNQGGDGKDDWKLSMLDIKMREGRRAKNPKSKTEPSAVRMPSIPIPLSLLARDAQKQAMGMEIVEQGMAPDEPVKIVALVESK